MDIEALKNTFSEEVTLFQSVYDKHAKHLPLWRWLKATMQPAGANELAARQTVEKVRTEGKKDEKIKLPGITPSALIAKGASRKLSDFVTDENFQAATFWMQFDLDLKENQDLNENPNLTPEHVRDALAQSPYIAFCGLSCSGNGVWGLVKVQDAEEHSKHFHQLVEDFQETGIQLDVSKGENLNDFRFYSYDPNAHVKPDFSIYTRKKQPTPLPQPDPTPLKPNYNKAYLEGTILDGGEILLATPNSKQEKHYCPSCGHKRFVRFVDTKTREYLNPEYGRCDRENTCRWYLHPSWPKART